MAYKTRRQLKRALAVAQCERDLAYSREAAAREAHDLEIRQLGRQLAEQQEHIDKVEAYRDTLRAQLDVATAEVARIATERGNAMRLLAYVAGADRTIVPVVEITRSEPGIDLVKRGDP